MLKKLLDTLLHFTQRRSSYSRVRLASPRSCASSQWLFKHALCEKDRTLQSKIGSRGFSFVELIITAAIAALVFGGLFASYESIISIIRESRLKANALALATERIEYIRSLPYASVGTQGGVPSGTLPQTSTAVLNGST